MLLHPATFLFFLILILTVFSMFSATSWFSAWLILEINLMSFIPIMLKKKSKYSTESILKYFLIQAFSSILLILTASVYLATAKTNWLMILALSLKIGLAPLHQWVIALVDGLTWESLMILLLIQKINPFILLSMIYKTPQASNLIFSFIIMSALLGSLGGLNQTSLPKILTFSSIAHMAWMATLINMNSSAWLLYFGLYFLVLSPLIYLLKANQIFTLTNMFTMPHFFMLFMLSLYLLSISGMPPFTGFIPKLLAIKIILTSVNPMVVLALLTSTFISLFFYMRLTLTNMFLSYNLNTMFLMTPPFTTSILNTFMLLFLPPVLLMVL